MASRQGDDARRAVALIPVNHLARAKGRLEGVLTAEQRAALSLATLGTVIEAALAARLEPLVLTADPAVVAATSGRATVMQEVEGVTGLNGQLEAALMVLEADADVLIMHADLPLAAGLPLRRLVATAPEQRSLTMVRSADGGTNVMLRRGGTFPLAYGPGSFEKHEMAGLLARMSVTEFRNPALQLDLDTRADIEVLLSTEEGRGSAAGLLLREWGLGPNGGG